MSRNIGNAIFSGNFEPRMAAPLDGRLVVDNKIDLYDLATWNGGDGNAYVYKGMVVSVINDTEQNNGLYRLTNENYTISSNWVLIGTADSSGNTQYVGTNGITVVDDKIELGGFIEKNTEISLLGGYLEFNSGVSFPKSLNGNITFFEKDNSGNYFVGGDFTKYGDVDVNKLIKLDSDFNLNTGFNSNMLGFDYGINTPKDIAFFNNNDFVVVFGNEFIEKFTSNGILLSDFELSEIPITNVWITKVGVQSTNKLLVGFSYYRSTDHPNIWRYDSDGVKDDTFNPPPFIGDADKGGGTNDFIIFDDDSILICGMLYYYDAINDAGFGEIMFLNADGEHIRKTINKNIIGLGYGEYYKIKKISNTEFLVFAYTYPSSKRVVAKMVYDGNSDTSQITQLFTQDGTIIEVKPTDSLTNGDFYVLYPNDVLVDNDINYGKILKFTQNAELDYSFNYYELGSGFNGDIFGIKIIDNDLILILGDFTTYNAVELSNNGIALFNRDFDLLDEEQSIQVKNSLIKYYDDYHKIYDDRTLVDKAYVDKKTLSSKLFFGNLTQTFYPYPVTENSVFGGLARRTAPEFDNLDKYSTALFDVIAVGDEENSYYGVQFPTKQSIVDFLNEKYAHLVNAGIIGRQIVITPYFLINDEVGHLNKVHGINKLYSVLRGKGNYMKSQIYTLYDGFYLRNSSLYPQIISDFNPIVVDIWKNIFPETNYSGFNIDTEMACRCMWFTQNNKHLYTQLAANQPLGFDDVGLTSSRYLYRPTENDFVNVNDVPTPRSITTAGSFILGISDDFKTHIIYDESFGSAGDKAKYKTKYYYNDSYNFVRVTILQSEYLGEPAYSLMVKPYGQDVFRLNFVPNISRETHDLYVMYYGNTKKHQPRILKINNAFLSNSIASDVSYVIEKKHWIGAGLGVDIYNGYTAFDTKVKNFCFFIGDKYGNITNLSAPVIITYRISEKGNLRSGLPYVDGK